MQIMCRIYIDASIFCYHAEVWHDLHFILIFYFIICRVGERIIGVTRYQKEWTNFVRLAIMPLEIYSLDSITQKHTEKYCVATKPQGIKMLHSSPYTSLTECHAFSLSKKFFFNGPSIKMVMAVGSHWRDGALECQISLLVWPYISHHWSWELFSVGSVLFGQWLMPMTSRMGG